jgi:hypothetical protein
MDAPPLPLPTYGNMDSTTCKANLPSKNAQKRKRGGENLQSSKRQNVNDPEDTGSPKTPNMIIFARSRIFYSRPSKTVRGKVMYGLRKERISHARYNLTAKMC